MKQGSIDNIWALVSFVVLALFVLGMTMFWNVISSEADDLWNDNTHTTNIKNNMERTSSQFDFMVVMGWMGLHLGILVTAYMLRTHPVMYILTIFFAVIIVIVSAPLSNGWNEIGQDDDLLLSARNEMPMTDFIMSRLPMFEVIWVIITGVVTFALAYNEGII